MSNDYTEEILYSTGYSRFLQNSFKTGLSGNLKYLRGFLHLPLAYLRHGCKSLSLKHHYTLTPMSSPTHPSPLGGGGQGDVVVASSRRVANDRKKDRQLWRECQEHSATYRLV